MNHEVAIKDFVLNQAQMHVYKNDMTQRINLFPSMLLHVFPFFFFKFQQYIWYILLTRNDESATLGIWFIVHRNLSLGKWKYIAFFVTEVTSWSSRIPQSLESHHHPEKGGNKSPSWKSITIKRLASKKNEWQFLPKLGQNYVFNSCEAHDPLNLE